MLSILNIRHLKVVKFNEYYYIILYHYMYYKLLLKKHLNSAQHSFSTNLKLLQIVPLQAKFR